MKCAQTHRPELTKLGYNPNKAYCGNVGGAEDEVCYNATKTPQLLLECQFDCDTDAECGYGLLCADAHKTELKAAGKNKRKANCKGNVGKWNEEVCFKKSLI